MYVLGGYGGYGATAPPGFRFQTIEQAKGKEQVTSSGLTPEQRQICEAAKKRLQPWMVSPECGLCPPCPPCECPPCPEVETQKAGGEAGGGVSWWWLIVAGVVGLGIGYGAARWRLR